MLVVVEPLGIEAELSRRLRALSAGQGIDSSGELTALFAVIERYLDFVQYASECDESLVERDTVACAILELTQGLKILSERTKDCKDVLEEIHRRVSMIGRRAPHQSKYEFSHWVGFPHGAVWRRTLSEFIGSNVKMLEVGSFEGRSATWILDNLIDHPDARLVCVDVFSAPYEEVFELNIKRTGRAGQVIKRKGRSHQVLPTLEPGGYDFIYLDAASGSLDQVADCCLSWGLLRDGGILAIDDYGGGAEWQPGVKAGTDAFLGLVKDGYSVIHENFQIILRKTGGRPA